MKARKRFEVKVTRGGLAPALLADPERSDSIEVLDLVEGEVVLFWDCLPREASRMEEALRLDLETLDPSEFLMRWEDARPQDFG